MHSKTMASSAAIAVAAFMFALVGCVSVEGTKAQLASGDPAQIAKAEENLIKIIGNGDQARNGSRSYSTAERMEFVEIVPNNDVIIAASEIALNDYHDYKDDKKIAVAAMQRLRFQAKADAAKFIIWAMKQKRFDYDETKEIFNKAFALLDEQATIKTIFDSVNSRKKRGDDDYELTRITDIMSPGAKGLNDRGSVYEYLERGHDREVSCAVLQHLVNVAQSPDLLCKILLDKILNGGDYHSVRINDEVRKSVEARLLTKVDQISDVEIIEQLFDRRSCTSSRYFTYISDTKLAAKLAVRLPKASQEKLAFDLIEDMDTEWSRAESPREVESMFTVIVVATSATKDATVKKKVADKLFKEIANMPEGIKKRRWAYAWDERDTLMADGFVAKLIKVNGTEWFAEAVAGLDKIHDFVAKHITPEIAEVALAKVGDKSDKTEVELAKKIDGAKITLAIFNGVRAAEAKNILEQKMPDEVKAQLVEASKKDVERILATAKTKETETFVLGGFYVGMPMEDAYILLRYYAGSDRKIEKRQNGKCDGIVLYGQQDWFALSFSDDKKTVRELNLGPWFLRKFCDYDAQNIVEWATAFERDKGYKMSYKLISETGQIWLDVGRPIGLTQHAYVYKSGKKGVMLTYFGERKFVAEGSLIENEGPRYFADYSASEGTLRIERYRD